MKRFKQPREDNKFPRNARNTVIGTKYVDKVLNPFSFLVTMGFLESKKDVDGFYNGAILPKTHSRYLWRISWISLLSAFYAIYRKYYDLAVVPFGVFLTSINYWRHPDYSWRRYIDIGYVHVALFYQIYRAYGSENMLAYYAILVFGVLFFPVGVYFTDISPWISTLLHGMVHIIGNISNMVLYRGHVNPFSGVGYF